MTVVILASASPARRRMLERAGVPLVCDAAAIDEPASRARSLAVGDDTAMAAETLARLKAVHISARHPGRLVIGADQMLECDGQWFDKPDSPAAAREQLRALSGRTHTLVSGAVMVRDDRVLWSGVGQARLTMRSFDESFLDWYLSAVGPEVCTTVGAYRIEELGIQLFSQVEGDHFVILGLPLLALLDALRDQGVVRS